MRQPAKFTVSGVVVEAEYCPEETGFWGAGSEEITVPSGAWAVFEEPGNWFAVTQEQIEDHYEPINLAALRELRRSGVDVDHIPGDEDDR